MPLIQDSTNPNFLTQYAGGDAAPSPNIPVADITPPATFATVPPPADPDYNAILAGTNQAQVTVDENQQAITDYMSSLGNESADQAALNVSSGVDAGNKALNDLTAQLLSLNNEAAAQQVRLENQPGVITSIAVGQQAASEKMRAIKALGISASIQAIQGNIRLATDQVNRALELKYDPIRAKIDVLNKQLEFNYKSLDYAQKKQADALKLINDEKLRQLDIKEAQEKDKNATLLNQMQSYPDAGITLQDNLETANQKIVNRSAIYKDKVRAPVGSGSGSAGFTSTQSNKGATNAGVSISDFKNYSDDAKNIFINGSTSVIKPQKSAIDSDFASGADPKETEAEILGSNLPTEVKDYLVKYLWSVFPPPKVKDNKPGLLKRIWNKIF